MITIKIITDIPKEFEAAYNTDKFEEFFSRVISDMNFTGRCGLCEQQIVGMLKKAFRKSDVIQEHDCDNYHNSNC